jgi:DNA-binding MarR family transcriptional regulator
MNPFPESLGALFIQVMKAHRHLADQELNKIGLYAGQEMLLLHLADAPDGLRPTELAECMGVEPPTITKMLQRMENGGWLVRRDDPEDGRATRIYATEQGKNLIQPIKAVWAKLEAITHQHLSDLEVALLRRILAQISHNLEQELKSE